MSASGNWPVRVKSLLQLGLEQTGLYGLYQFGLRSGQIARQTPVHTLRPAENGSLAFPWEAVDPATLAAVLQGREAALRIEADEILTGQFRCFGGPLRPIALRPALTPPAHWTRPTCESLEQDVKWFWEAARFGWAITLARTYARFGDERCARAFWERLEEFVSFNPVNAGPNWASAQEVAVRLMAVAFAASVLQASPQTTIERMRLLRAFLIAHAERIPPTLNYARSQNNNHLLTEAAGLWTAGLLLGDHPDARRWSALGQANFNRGILKQVALDGSYAQFSCNYHRVLLHTALWIAGLYAGQKPPRDVFTPGALTRLQAAVRWLLGQVDPASGQVPNYGHNDGANLLPLAVAEYGDFRPTLQAAGRIFLGRESFAPGPWDEACLWLGCPVETTALPDPVIDPPPAVLRLNGRDSWAMLRAVRYHSRPAHADQLHVDLWFQGQPLALDGGTYAYNAPAPWQNALASVAVHNSVQIDDLEPMTRAGRFLWLDWDQARLLPGERSGGEIAACRDGYRRIGVRHERRLGNPSDRAWLVIDRLTPAGRKRQPHSVRLHWLLADLPWSLTGSTLELRHPDGTVRLSIECPSAGVVTLDRAGERLSGAGSAAPISGWFSPTYGVRLPALSFSVTWQGSLPLEIHSRWELPGGSSSESAGF